MQISKFPGALLAIATLLTLVKAPFSLASPITDQSVSEETSLPNAVSTQLSLESGPEGRSLSQTEGLIPVESSIVEVTDIAAPSTLLAQDPAKTSSFKTSPRPEKIGISASPQLPDSFGQVAQTPLRQKLREQVLNQNSMGQLTSVDQLRDVSPGSWAYEALRNLVENYGCILGYPDLTHRGTRSLTRWEFAAGLNACLTYIEQLIQENVALLREDVDLLKRLAQEFRTELVALGTRIDNVEARVSFLEDHQFSTTTKLLGSAVFAAADVFGGDGGNNQTVFQQRTVLSFATSFTGKDLLLTSLWAGNAPLNNGFNLAGTDFGLFTVPSAEGTLSSQFGANTLGDVRVLFTSYQFPVGDRLQVHISQGFDVFHSFIPTLNPLLDDSDLGRGSISTFGQRSAIYNAGGGAGAGINFNITDNLLLSGGYLANGNTAADPSPGQGLFNGGYGALGQLTWDATDQFSVAAVYVNSYSPPGTFGFHYNGLAVGGTAVANTLAGQVNLLGLIPITNQDPVITNAYSGQFTWRPVSEVVLSGWFVAAFPRLIGEGDGEILSYALTVALPDLGNEGDLLGLVAGASPYLTDFDGGSPQPFEVDTPWHLEAFYRFQINDHISITPGAIWLLAPNQDSDNPDDVIGTVRTTFQF